MKQLIDVDLFSDKYHIVNCHPLGQCFHSCPKIDCADYWHFFNTTKNLPLPEVPPVDFYTFTMLNKRGLRKQAEYRMNLIKRIEGDNKDGRS